MHFNDDRLAAAEKTLTAYEGIHEDDKIIDPGEALLSADTCAANLREALADIRELKADEKHWKMLEDLWKLTLPKEERDEAEAERTLLLYWAAGIIEKLKAIETALRTAELSQCGWEAGEDIVTLNGEPIGCTISKTNRLEFDRWWPSVRAALLRAATSTDEQKGAT